MRPCRLAACTAVLVVVATMPGAETLTIGGDLYTSDMQPGPVAPAARDLFFAGPSAEMREPVAADAHLAGISVTVEAKTGGDLYAAGGNVSIEAPVGDDLSAFGYTVSLDPRATVGGNARLSGGSVRIEAPVAGALAASAGSLTLDARVAGDAWLSGRTVTFGPDAAVGGTLHIATADPVAVPASVAPSDRVVLEPIDFSDMPMHGPGWADRWMPRDWHGWQAPPPMFFLGGALLGFAFLLVLGAAALALFPERVQTLRRRATRHPWIALLAGLLGFSTMVGLIPVCAVTLIGLPLVPVVVLALVVLWTLGYLLGAYTAAAFVLDGFGRREEPHATGRALGALALGLAVATVLNSIPVIGWMANLVLGFIGIGAIAAGAFARLGELLATPPANTRA